jgi:glycosyltransferase involved in cell wall biosynthesis
MHGSGLCASPLVSVVMPSFNQSKFIDKSIASVLEQDYASIELIVADGGSTDGTLDKLAAWKKRDRRIRHFSEPDSGPADALNKALRQVRGTIIGWLNSDDVYTPGAVGRAVEAFEAHGDWICVYGHGDHVDEEGNRLDSYPTLPPPSSTSQLLEACFICQPTVFFKRSMYVLLGPLDDRLRAVFDFEYWLRMFTRLPERVGFVDALQAQSRLHPDCITRRMQRTVALEALEVVKRHLGQSPTHWLTAYADAHLGAATSADADAASLKALLEDARAILAPNQYRDLAIRWQLDTVDTVDLHT